MDLSLAGKNNNNLKGGSFFSGFWMLIGLAVLGLVVASFISAGILLAKSGGNIIGAQEALKNPAYAGTVRLMQLISVLISMALPTFVVAAILSRKPWQLLGFRKEAPGAQLALSLAIIVVSMIVAAAFGLLNQQIVNAMGLSNWSEQLEKNYQSSAEMMLDMKGTGGLLISLVIMAFVPAVCEEMLFRGGLQNFLTRATGRPWLSILIVSAIFSLVHFSASLFLVRMFLGVVLGLVYHQTKNIWMSIAMHFFNNALTVTSVYFMVQQGKSMQEAMNADVSLAYWGFLGLPLLVFLFFILKKNTAATVADA